MCAIAARLVDSLPHARFASARACVARHDSGTFGPSSTTGLPLAAAGGGLPLAGADAGSATGGGALALAGSSSIGISGNSSLKQPRYCADACTAGIMRLATCNRHGA